jgi:hypothetical protein
MANLIDILNDDIKSKFIKRLSRIIQSANLNFLIGSGCSYPALEASGDTEKNIVTARTADDDDDKAEKLLHDFLVPFLDNTKLLMENDVSGSEETIENYQSFLGNISNILFNRKNNIIPCQAIIFSTNYDLLLEYSMNDYSQHFILCDGFKRTSNINKEYYFSSTEYFNSVFNTGNLYRYKVEIPIINLIKIHGSLNWRNKNGKIIQSLSYIKNADKIKNSKDIDDIKLFNSLFNIVLPQDNKLKLTILDEIYYDLLRIYSNELDKENTILIVEGFSFADQHILEITKRALKNKTFNLVVFCYNEKDKTSLLNIFKSYRNVDIISNGKKNLDFKLFNSFISEIFTPEEDNV